MLSGYKYPFNVSNPDEKFIYPGDPGKNLKMQQLSRVKSSCIWLLVIFRISSESIINECFRGPRTVPMLESIILVVQLEPGGNKNGDDAIRVENIPV